MDRDHPTRAAGRAARDEQRRLAEAVVRGANDAIVTVDLAGRITLWNDACERMFGWREAEMLGRDASVLLPPGREHELASALEGLDETAPLETDRLHRTGRLVPVSRRTAPLHDESGGVVGVCAIFRDISRELELRRQLEQSRSVAETRFRQSAVAQATVSPQGVLLDVNPALCRLLGRDQRELLGRSVLDLVLESERDEAAANLALLASGERSESRHERTALHADGRVVDTRISVFSVKDSGTGEVLRLEAMVEDISETVAAQRELQLREARAASLALNTADVGFFCSADAELLYVSPSVERHFGYRPEDVVGSVGFEFWHPEDEPGVRAVWEAAVAGPAGRTSVFEARVRHADGTWRWVEETVTNRLDEPEIAAMVVNLKDVTDRKRIEHALEELAGKDVLTGLPTRGPLMAALDAGFAAGRAATTAVAVVDLARFRLVNETLGHRGGDTVLAEVAARLSVAVCGRGVVARLGGDRFAVALSDVVDIADLFELAAELLAEVERPLSVEGEPVSLTAHVGAVLGPASDAGALLSSAEAALRSATSSGDGPLHVVRADSASTALFRARLVEELRRGVERGEVVVHFQPVVSLADGRPVGAEALVRWEHPERGLLLPGAFIDVAEESGLLGPIGDAVLREACLAAADWSVSGARLRVSVNLSATQLTRPGLVDRVRTVLDETGARPTDLLLEVTESAVMSDMQVAVAALQELRELGVGVAVDDFGTGYSSLTYVRQFPVTALKIDRSFVGGLGQSGDDAAIVSSVISLAASMGLECIAEGVESEPQRLVLQALGCRLAQGFLWSQAVDRPDVDAWLTAAIAHADGGAAPRRRDDEETRAAALARALDMHASGASPHTIAAALNANRLLTPEGRRWSARTVSLLLARHGRRSAG
ncbi:MAG: EAL domain-containing protein [Actinomycetes bacterium]